MKVPKRHWVLHVIAFAGFSTASTAAELPLRQIVKDLFAAKPGVRLDFSRKDLSLLDLSGIDFKRANLAGANLLGDDLRGANLSGVDLSGAKLDRTSLARANFNDADLSHATLFDAVGSLSFEAPAASAPTFVGANLSGARIFARLSRADFRHANLAGAHLGTERNQFKMPKETDLSGTLFAGASLQRADLTGANLVFSNLAGANLKGALLARADLSNANLTGADLTETDFSGADVYGTVFKNAKGLTTAIGLDHARNRDRAIF